MALNINVFSTTDLCLDSGRLHSERNWTHTPSASGSYSSRLADKIGMSLKLFKNSLQVKLFKNLLCLIAVQCYYSVSNVFWSAFLKLT